MPENEPNHQEGTPPPEKQDLAPNVPEFHLTLDSISRQQQPEAFNRTLIGNLQTAGNRLVSYLQNYRQEVLSPPNFKGNAKFRQWCEQKITKFIREIQSAVSTLTEKLGAAQVKDLPVSEQIALIRSDAHQLLGLALGGSAGVMQSYIPYKLESGYREIDRAILTPLGVELYEGGTTAVQGEPQEGMQTEARTDWAKNRLATLKDTIGKGITPAMAQSWLIQFEHDAFVAGDLESPGNSPQALLAVQASLRQLGYFQGERLDGVFGPRTEKALRAFQEHWNQEHPDDRITAHGLPVPETKSRLIKAMTEKQAPAHIAGAGQGSREPGGEPKRRNPRPEAVPVGAPRTAGPAPDKSNTLSAGHQKGRQIERTEREALENAKRYFEAKRDNASVVTAEGIADRTQLNAILKFLQYKLDGVPVTTEETETATTMVKDYISKELKKLPPAEREKELRNMEENLSYL